MSADGKLHSVEGTEALRNAALAEVRGEPVSVQQTVMQFVNLMTGNDMMAGHFSGRASEVPARALKTGMEWDASETYNAGFDVAGTILHKVEAITPHSVELSTSGNFNVGGEKPIEMMEHSFRGNIDGTQKGTIQIDPHTGLLIRSSYSLNLKGNLQANFTEIPVTIKIEKRIKGRKEQ